MNRIKVLAADKIVKSALDEIRSLGCEVDESSYSAEELPIKLRDYDILLVRAATKVTRHVLETMGSDTKLKLIIRAGVGLDSIDLEAAESLGIEVKNTPNSSIDSVAELAIGHMLTLARHIYRANTSMKQGEWLKKDLMGIELKNSRLGIIGLGRIGRGMADKASALGMKVQYNKRSGPEKGAESYQFVDLDTLISTSDFITLHVPKIPGTPPILGKAEFEKMKQGAFVINCARGGVIDEEALLEALDSGKLGGAALDVFEKEPPDNEALMKHEKVSLSPHIGASTNEAQERIGTELVEIVKAFYERSGQSNDD